MTEIEAIYARHSVRSYKKQPIDASAVAQLEKMIHHVNAVGNLHLQFLPDAGQTFSRFLSKAMGLGSAPSVIACVGPDDDTLDERIGYYGEKIVLTAQQLGLNTCWAGTFNPKGTPCQVRDGERLVIVIAIGYGTTQGRVRKTRTADQVSVAPALRPDWFDKGVEYALLAPTAINQQHFEIRLGSNGEVSFKDKGGVFSKVDLGIVKYHFDVAREAGR